MLCEDLYLLIDSKGSETGLFPRSFRETEWGIIRRFVCLGFSFFSFHFQIRLLTGVTLLLRWRVLQHWEIPLRGVDAAQGTGVSGGTHRMPSDPRSSLELLQEMGRWGGGHRLGLHQLCHRALLVAFLTRDSYTVRGIAG